MTMTSTTGEEGQVKRAGQQPRHQATHSPKSERKCMDIGAFFFLQYDVLHLLVDEVLLVDITDEQLRHAPDVDQRSLAWLLWSATRWEDIALTMLERDTSQVLYQANWRLELGGPSLDLGILMSVE